MSWFNEFFPYISLNYLNLLLILKNRIFDVTYNIFI